MGDTKAKQLPAGIKFARMITAAMAGIFFFILLTQIIIFPHIKISFYTGADAQQLESLQIKRGSDVELPTPLKPGSCFLGWSLSPNGSDIIKSSGNLLRNSTLYAVWDGIEKYAVLSVNGVQEKEVNIFDSNVSGVTPAQLNQEWRINDDYFVSDNLKALSTNATLVNPANNYSRFLGWKYLNSFGTYNDLLCNDGEWVLVERDSFGNEIKCTEITDTNRFYPPNYRTTFHALLDYRTMYVQFYDQSSTDHIRSLSQKVKLGDSISFPVFTTEINPNAQFSHWEVQLGNLSEEYISDAEYAELKSLMENVKTRYEAGEVLETLDPLLYYWGSKLISYGGGVDDLVSPLTVRAVYWDNANLPQYSFQTYTDSKDGEELIDFSQYAFDDLSIQNPVALENGSIRLCDNEQILAYTFYDHNGVFHEIKTTALNGNTGFNIGSSVDFLGKTLYFNNQWAIKINVIYRSSQKNIDIKFNLGNNVYTLPSYIYQETETVITQSHKLGKKIVLLTGESYMKTNYIFTGWKKVGDTSERIYVAGELFTISKDTVLQENVIEFEAVWRLQRLLFDFDMNGGNWDTEVDYNSMKGAYGNNVRILATIPVKFGYDFAGWSLQREPVAGSELLHPGDTIFVDTKIQTLYAQWQPKRLRVAFYLRDTNNEWKRTAFLDLDSKTEQVLKTDGYIKLPAGPDNYRFSFVGWNFNEEVLLTGQEIHLNATNISKFEYAHVSDNKGALLEVRMYAVQNTRTITAEYSLDVSINDFEKVSLNVDSSKLESQLVQGELFTNYYPFSVAKENFDINGREFICWSYNNGVKDVPIKDDTVVPIGKNKILIYGELSKSKKQFAIEYCNSLGNAPIDTNLYSYKSEVLLKPIDSADEEKEKWGKFIGWALEPDSIAGNPDIIYLSSTTNNSLKLINQTNADEFSINIDKYAKKNSKDIYVLKLFAVYAKNHVTITYYDLENTLSNGTVIPYTELKLPVYLNNNFNESAFGGTTIAPSHEQFLEYGNVVLDDSTLPTYGLKRNFVGWKASIPNKSSEDISKKQFEAIESKLWFPGEYLPSINFDIEFNPVFCEQSSNIAQVKIGEKEYNVLSLSLSDVKKQIICNSNVDIVVLPVGNYKLSEGQIIINSEYEVRVIIPASGSISVAQRAIQCNTIKEIYIGDNLTITGSPVVGDNFEAYLVQKGYRVINENETLSEVLNASNKYDYSASMKGLLVGKESRTLYSVPSGIKMTSETLFNLLNTYSLQCIASYAFSDMKLDQINIGFELKTDQAFVIEDYAIYNGSMTHIILPKCQTVSSNITISSQAIAGKLSNLATVTFGDNVTANTSYAFVENGFLYYVDNNLYPLATTHIMYVLSSVKLESLEYMAGNSLLHFADSVQMIEPYALMGCNWDKIHSLRAENEKIDLRIILGIPNDVPFFINVNNVYKNYYANPLIQSYKKSFVFAYNGNETVVEYTFGQTFKVLDAQNNDKFHFEKEWCQFVGWHLEDNNKLFYVGESYKVGISEAIQGDKYTVRFNADDSTCWKHYPVEFYIFNGKTNESFVPSAFYDTTGNKYSLESLLKYYNYIGNIYLPGINHSFVTPEGDVYQFIGWKTSQTNPNDFDSLLWNNTDINNRILPNKTAKTELNRGVVTYEENNKIYKYYALYEKVTPNLSYKLLEDKKTFAVTGGVNTTISSLAIPFAKYENGYMLPISTIKASAFSSTINNTNLSEIVIGGAVSEIEQMAFKDINVKKIVFNHTGSEILYNKKQATASKQLTIGREAFANNTVITNLILPVALKKIDERAFQSCISLVDVRFNEDSDLPALNYIGDFVFRDNYKMLNNEIIELLVNDGKNGTTRFADDSIGNGIFMNTKLGTINDAEGRPTNRIVWKNKLLHVCYISSEADSMFNEKEIGGYAFVSAESDLDVDLKFTNAGTKIDAAAFSYLHRSIDKISMKYNAVSVSSANVDFNAFDDTISHDVEVYVNNQSSWDKAFKTVNRPLNRYTFTS